MKKFIALMLLGLLVLLPSVAGAQESLGAKTYVTLRVDDPDVAINELTALTSDAEAQLRAHDVLIIQVSIQNITPFPITWTPFESFVLSDGKTEMTMSLLLTKIINPSDYNEWDAGQLKTMYFVFFAFPATFDVEHSFITDINNPFIYIPINA